MSDAFHRQEMQRLRQQAGAIANATLRRLQREMEPADFAQLVDISEQWDAAYSLTTKHPQSVEARAHFEAARALYSATSDELRAKYTRQPC